MSEQNAAAVEFEARLDYRQNAAAYMANGITEADLVKGRRIDAGLDHLEPGSAAKAAASAPAVNATLLADPANTGFRNEYEQGRQVYMQNGITEEQYIRSRRIDVGLEPLVIGGAVAKS